jgi:glycine cleavage system H lipoate-binding protein
MIYEFDLLIFNNLTLYIYYIELMKLDHLKKFTPIYAMESVKLDKDRNNPIQSFQLSGNDQIVKSPVVMRIKPINHSNTKMFSLDLEGPESFPNNNICVTGEPLHVAYI